MSTSDSNKRQKTNDNSSPGTNQPLAPVQAPSRNSGRLQEKHTKEAEVLQKRAAKLGGQPLGHSKNDLTPFFLQPLDPGADSRGYTASSVRQKMLHDIARTRDTVSSLSKSELPAEAILLFEDAIASGRQVTHQSTRSKADQFRSGSDSTLTVNQYQSFDEKRKGSDTPRPRSPSPERTGESLPNTRYEDSHQSAYRFTRAPGTTVHGPTQGNQVVDTAHESFAASTSHSKGFVFRYDTYHHSSVYSGRQKEDKKWEVQHSSYRRRAETTVKQPSTPSNSKDTGKTSKKSALTQ